MHSHHGMQSMPQKHHSPRRAVLASYQRHSAVRRSTAARAVASRWAVRGASQNASPVSHVKLISHGPTLGETKPRRQAAKETTAAGHVKLPPPINCTPHHTERFLPNTFQNIPKLLGFAHTDSPRSPRNHPSPSVNLSTHYSFPSSLQRCPSSSDPIIPLFPSHTPLLG